MYEGPEFLEEQDLTLSDEPSSVLSSNNTVQAHRSKLQDVPGFERVAVRWPTSDVEITDLLNVSLYTCEYALCTKERI